MEKGDSPTLILDNGTGYIKMGFSNQNLPQLTYPSMIGRPVMNFGKAKKKDLDKVMDLVFGKKCEE